MKTSKRPKFVTCPRCGLKMIEGLTQCENCGLVFERLAIATNKDAKRKIKRGDRDYIIYTHHLPKDVKYWKLILLVALTGLFGGHNYYVGRYLRGAFFTLSFAVILACSFFNSYIMAHFPQWMELIGALFIGPFGLLWLWDCTMVLLKRFKVPVAIDLQTQDMDEFLKEKK